MYQIPEFLHIHNIIYLSSVARGLCSNLPRCHYGCRQRNPFSWLCVSPPDNVGISTSNRTKSRQYLEQQVGPHDMEALEGAEQAVEDVVSREHLVGRVLQSVKNSGLKNPTREDHASTEETGNG